MEIFFAFACRSSFTGTTVVLDLAEEWRAPVQYYIRRDRLGELPLLTIRDWKEADARGILEVHYAAVHGAPVNYYDEDRLDEWSPQVDEERILAFLTRPQIEEEITRVAEQDEQIVGFGTVVPARQELRACYVHPRYNRQGIGRRLMEALEEEARAAGLGWLNLNASLNAEEFYKSVGYVADGLGRHRLASGNTIACVHMYKFL